MAYNREMDKIALLILSDDRLTRAGLAAVLTDAADLTVLGESGSHGDIADLLDLYAPDLLLWDLGWDPAHEDGDSTALQRLAAAADLDVPVVALLPDPAWAMETWHTGVVGLLPRSIGVGPLCAALLAAANGLRVLDPSLAQVLITPQSDPGLALLEPLTPREEEVLTLLAEGMTNRAIGRALSISEHTAKFHVQALMGKLGAQSRTEAVVRADASRLAYALDARLRIFCALFAPSSKWILHQRCREENGTRIFRSERIKQIVFFALYTFAGLR